MFKVMDFLTKVKKSELIRGIYIYSLGSMGSKVINLGIYPLLTFFLNKSDLGYYDLIINTIYLAVPIATLQTSDAIFRFTLTTLNKKRKTEIITNGFLLIFLSTFILLSIIYLFFYNNNSIYYKELIFIMAFVFCINLALKQVARGLQKNKSYVVSEIVYSATFMLFLLAALFIFNLGLKGVLISFILTNLSSIIYLIFSTNFFSYITFKDMVDKYVMKDLMKYSIPLIPNSLSWWLVSSVNTWIIVLILGLESNGVYAIAVKLSSIVYIFNKVFGLAWQDKIITSKTENTNYNSKVFNLLLFFLFTIIIFMIILSRPILKIVISPEFYEAWIYLPWLLIATVFASISSYFGAFYLKWKKTDKIFISTILGSITTITFSYILTSLYGLTGTALSVLSGFLVISIYRYFDTKKKLKLKISPIIIIPIVILSLVITLNFYI